MFVSKLKFSRNFILMLWLFYCVEILFIDTYQVIIVTNSKRKYENSTNCRFGGNSPPEKYGGTERVMGWLIDALVDKGHEVTLFACAGSKTKARLIESRDQPVRTDPELSADIADLFVMLKNLEDMAGEFDVIHSHIDFFHYPYLRDYAQTTLTTLHGRQDMKGLNNIYKTYTEFGLISISDQQRIPAPDANFVETVYHGMPADLLKPNYDTDQEYVAFLGRFAPKKMR